jgi:hypothetical protein
MTQTPTASMRSSPARTERSRRIITGPCWRPSARSCGAFRDPGCERHARLLAKGVDHVPGVDAEVGDTRRHPARVEDHTGIAFGLMGFAVMEYADRYMPAEGLREYVACCDPDLSQSWAVGVAAGRWPRRRRWRVRRLTGAHRQPHEVLALAPAVRHPPFAEHQGRATWRCTDAIGSFLVEAAAGGYAASGKSRRAAMRD